MKKLFTLLLTIVATTLWAQNNVITYTASSKLEIQDNAFNVAIADHSYADGTGTITFAGEVTHIGKSAFFYCSSLTSIHIPASVTYIGDFAFAFCPDISFTVDANNPVYRLIDNVSLIDKNTNTLICGTQSTTQSIYINHYGRGALAGSTKFTSLHISSSGQKITFDYAAFWNSGLTSMEIPWNVVAIDTAAFAECPNLESIKWYSDISLVPVKFCYKCPKLKSVQLPDAITKIGDEAFYLCSSLSNINFPNGIQEIGGYSFAYTDFNTISFPSSLKRIGASAFGHCTNLRSIVLQDSVEFLDYWAFGGCTSLSEITCHAQTPPLCGNDCFYDVDKSIPVYVPVGSVDAYKAADGWKEFFNIQAIPQPNNIITYTASSKLNISSFEFTPAFTSHEFSDGVGTITFDGDVTSIGDNAFSSCTSLFSIAFPNSVTSIGNFAFSECSSLSSITIHHNITSIGHGAFASCTSLDTIIVDAANAHYVSIDGVLFNYTKDTLLQYPAGNSRTTYTIPNSTTNISNSAFSSCKSLSSIVLPNSITSIEVFAFSDCSSLSSIYIPNYVKKIGRSAFIRCFSLADIEVDDNNTSFCDIDGVLFNKAKDTLIAYPNGSLRTEYSIPIGVRHIEVVAFSAASFLSSITFSNNPLHIHDAAFYDCTAISSIISYCPTPPQCNYDCFHGIDKSIPVYVPAASVTAYKAAYAWKDFTNILPIPCFVDSGKCGDNLTWELSCDSVLTISGTGAMYDFNNSFCNQCAPWHDCYSVIDSTIKEVIVEPGVTTIGNMAFSLCINLQSVSLPEGLQRIGNMAFSSTPLTSITLPQSLKTIDEYAFEWCDKLTNVVIPDSVVSIGRNAFAACQAMTQCHLGEGLQSIDFVAFQSCVSLTSIEIPKNVSSIGYSLFAMDSSLVEITVAKDNPYFCSVDGVLFSKDTTILWDYPGGKGQTYTMPQTVREIQYGAFAENVKLQEVIYSDSLTTIGDYAFSGNRELRIVTLPDSVKHIGQWAYANCMQVDSVRLGSSITEIGDCALMNMAACRIIDCYLPAPISVGTQALDYIPNSCLLVVNPGTYSQWASAQDWNTLTIVERKPIHKEYTISASANNTKFGFVSGAGTYVKDTAVYISATANTGYQFNQWSDGNTDNPRLVQVTSDSTFIAEFGVKQCAFSVASNDILIGAVLGTKDGTYDYGTQISLEASPNSGYEFVKWSNGATYNPYKFTIVDDTELYAFFREEDAPDVPDIPTFIPGSTTVTIIWPQVSNAFHYQIIIWKDSSKQEKICTLTFNILGMLINIDFGPSPMRRSVVENTTSDVAFQFTVTGLDEGTSYYYEMVAEDKDGEELNTESGEFTTTGGTPTIIGTQLTDSPANQFTKIIKNGQLLILRDGKTYNAQGREAE